MKGVLSNQLNVLDAGIRECFRSFGRLPGSVVLDDDGLCGVRTGLPLTFFNGIASGRDVARALDTFRGQSFRWWVRPAIEPDLGATLTAHGFRVAFRHSAGMVADLTAPPAKPRPPAEFTIERVMDAAGMQQWVDVFIAGFERPLTDGAVWLGAYTALGLHDDAPWAHFVGFLDGTPIATASVLVTGEIAGIYHIVTLPPARGRGIGAAITNAALEHARHAGATQAMLQASEMGVSVYRAVGFVECCDLTLYDWRPVLA